MMGYSFKDNKQSKVNYRGYKINRPTITDMTEICYPRNWHFYFKTRGKNKVPPSKTKAGQYKNVNKDYHTGNKKKK